jgi:hypothetical protein
MISIAEEVQIAAKVCVRLEHENKCDRRCKNCHWNISSYIPVTPAEEKMLKNRAIRDCITEDREKRDRTTSWSVIIGLIIVIVFGFTKGFGTAGVQDTVSFAGIGVLGIIALIFFLILW